VKGQWVASSHHRECNFVFYQSEDGAGEKWPRRGIEQTGAQNA